MRPCPHPADLDPRRYSPELRRALRPPAQVGPPPHHLHLHPAVREQEEAGALVSIAVRLVHMNSDAGVRQKPVVENTLKDGSEKST